MGNIITSQVNSEITSQVNSEITSQVNSEITSQVNSEITSPLLSMPPEMIWEITQHLRTLEVFQLSRTCKEARDLRVLKTRIEGATNSDKIAMSNLILTFREFTEYSYAIFQDVALNFNKYNIRQIEAMSKNPKLWTAIVKTQALTEQFIEKYCQELEWNNICVHQNLSDQFIKKHEANINWSIISKKRKMSVAFVINNDRHIKWDQIWHNQNFSYDEIKVLHDHYEKLLMKKYYAEYGTDDPFY
jgi:hypothetical protein